MLSPPSFGSPHHPLDLTKVCLLCYQVYSRPQYYTPQYTMILWEKGCYYPGEHQWNVYSNHVTVVLNEAGKPLKPKTTCIVHVYTRVIAHIQPASLAQPDHLFRLRETNSQLHAPLSENYYLFMVYMHARLIIAHVHIHTCTYTRTWYS